MLKLSNMAIILALVLGVGPLYGQIKRQIKIGYVDVEKVFESYPDTDDVKAHLAKEKEKYEIEINKRKEEIASLEKSYQETFDKLTEDEKQRRESEISYKKEALSAFIDDANKRLDALKEKLVTPIYDKIRSVISKVSAEKGFSFVFRSSSQTVLYADKEFNITKDVMMRLNKELELDQRY